MGRKAFGKDAISSGGKAKDGGVGKKDRGKNNEKNCGGG